jgi:hypothetical protein
MYVKQRVKIKDFVICYKKICFSATESPPSDDRADGLGEQEAWQREADDESRRGDENPTDARASTAGQIESQVHVGAQHGRRKKKKN